MAPEGAGGSVSRHEPDSFSRAELEEYLDEYACMEEQALAMEIEKRRAEKMLAELESSKSALEAQVLEIEAERKDMKQVGRGVHRYIHRCGGTNHARAAATNHQPPTTNLTPRPSPPCPGPARPRTCTSHHVIRR